MPRNTNPEDIAVGSGTAGEGSVSASSLTVNLTTLEGGGTVGGISAEEVSSDTTLGVGDNDVQGNLDVLDALAPEPRPNLLGAATVGTPYPSALSDWTLSETLVDGRTSFLLGLVKLVNNAATLDINNVPLFPADRGILAVTADLGGGPQVLQALDLGAIFLEGNGPEDIGGGGLDSRWKGQPDYTGGTNPAGTVNGLDQDIDLTSREPVLETGTWSDFGYNYYGYQMATAAISITLRSENNGILELVHFKTLQDLDNEEAASGPVNVYSRVPLTGGLNLFNDPDTATNVVVNSFSLGPNDTTTSVDNRTLSGITYYGPSTDPFTLTYSVDGLYTFSYLEEGVEIRLRNQADDWGLIPINYTDYTSTDTAGSTATDTDAAYLISGGYVTGGIPAVIGSDPFGRNDPAASAVAVNQLIHTGTYGTPNTTVELFEDEGTRYTGLDAVTGDFDLDPLGTSSTWDSTAALANTDLQVRGIPSGVGLAEGQAGGGELSWPTINYSATHYPSTRNGTDPQRDYSALATPAGTRSYLRAFDVASSKKQIQVRIEGRTPGTLWNALRIDDLSSGSASGASLAFVTQRTLRTEGSYQAMAPVEIGGALLGVVEEDDNTIVATLQLKNAPVKVGSFFPIIFVATFTEGTDSGDGSFALLKVEIL